MSVIDLIYVILLGIVEGLTEFLPISSTGHLIVAQALLGFPTAALGVADRNAFQDTFGIFINLGAVFAVVVYFAPKILAQVTNLPSDRKKQTFWLNLFIAFLPAAVVGFLFRKEIKFYLFNPTTIGITLIVGGIIFLILESRPREPKVTTMDEMTPLQALWVGIAQIFSLIPGTSRSGATIVGGMLAGLSRQTITEFTFFLAIPTLGLATLLDLYSAVREKVVDLSQLPYFAVGVIVAFFVAWASIAWLLNYIKTNSFRVFGVYRIIAGVIILALVLFNVIK